MKHAARSLLSISAALATAATIGALPASADARTRPSVSFFHGGAGQAHWSQDTSNSNDPFSMELDVPGGTDFAGIYLHHVDGRPAPAEPPSFDFRSNQTGPSLGSPRLHINFSDGGAADLRPLAWVKDQWTHEDGGGNDWDNYGGTCGFQYETTYENVLSCHPGTTVTSAYVVSDSGYAYPTGYVHYIDNLQYDGATIAKPSDNGNSTSSANTTDQPATMDPATGLVSLLALPTLF